MAQTTRAKASQGGGREATWSAPSSPAQRIVALDAVRGVALMGILFVNVWAFGMPMAAYLNPTAYGDFSGINWFAWAFTHVFFEEKFITLFSLLFGAGVLLFTDRADTKGRPALGLHLRRMMWLLVFGLAHAYLLWYGDVLAVYAVCGVFAYLFRRRRPRTLIAIGVALIAIPSLLMFAGGFTYDTLPEAERAGFEAQWAPDDEAIQRELAAYRGSWEEQAPLRIEAALHMHTVAFAFYHFWRVLGIMLIGMALYRLALFNVQGPARAPLVMLAVGITAGLPLVLLGVWQNTAAGWEAGYSFYIGSQFNYWGSLFLAGAYLAGLLLLLRRRDLHAWATPLVAMGRMAFTNYILQTLVMTTIFYGHGLGLFGIHARALMIPLVVGVLLLQVWASTQWLRRYRYGPLEWLWRSLTYWRLAPMRGAALPHR